MKVQVCHQMEALPPLPSTSPSGMRRSGSRNSLKRSSNHRRRRRSSKTEDDNNSDATGSLTEFDMSNHTARTNTSAASNDSAASSASRDEEIKRLSTEISDMKHAMDCLQKALKVASVSGTNTTATKPQKQEQQKEQQQDPRLFSPNTYGRKASWADLDESFQWDSDDEDDEKHATNRRTFVKERIKEERLARLERAHELQRAIELKEEKLLKEEEAKMEQRLDTLQARKAQRIAKAKAKAAAKMQATSTSNAASSKPKKITV